MTETTESFLFKRYTYENGKFRVPGEPGLRSIPTGSEAEILENFHKSININISQAKAKALQDALNKAIGNQSVNYQKLVKKMINDLDKGLLDQLQHLDEEVNGEIKKIGNIVTYKGANFSLSTNPPKKYDAQLRRIAAELPNAKEVLPATAPIKDVIAQLNGSLNTLRGDIFENILAYILRESGDVLGRLMSEKEDEVVNSLVASFEDTLSKKLTQRKGALVRGNKNPKKTARVTGSDTKNSISLTIEDNKYTVSGAKGKTDVMISTSLSGDVPKVVGISAKSYSGSGKIHLLSKANLAGLISRWEATDTVVNSLALNAFSSRDLWASYRDKTEEIFLFQALAGSSKEELLSQLFIVNKNTKKNPYVVFSTYDLLTNGTNISAEITMDAPNREVPRSRDFFYRFAKETTVSVKTKESVNKLAKSVNANIGKKP